MKLKFFKMTTNRIKFLIIRNKFRNCHRKTVFLNPRIKNYLMKHIRNQVLLNKPSINEQEKNYQGIINILIRLQS